jgi:hypothetical protein
MTPNQKIHSSDRFTGGMDFEYEGPEIVQNPCLWSTIRRLHTHGSGQQYEHHVLDFLWYVLN